MNKSGLAEQKVERWNDTMVRVYPKGWTFWGEYPKAYIIDKAEFEAREKAKAAEDELFRAAFENTMKEFFPEIFN